MARIGEGLPSYKSIFCHILHNCRPDRDHIIIQLYSYTKIIQLYSYTKIIQLYSYTIFIQKLYIYTIYTKNYIILYTFVLTVETNAPAYCVWVIVNYFYTVYTVFFPKSPRFFFGPGYYHILYHVSFILFMYNNIKKCINCIKDI